MKFKNQKPVVAFLIPGLGVVERGAENVVLELAKRLNREFEIVIFSQGTVAELADLPAVTVRKIWALSRDNRLTNFFYHLHPKLTAFLDLVNLSPSGLEMLSFTLMSLPVLLFQRFDLLFPVSGFWGALSCRFIRWLKRTPFVYASHGGEEPLIVRQNPNLYIALSDYTQRWLKSFKPGLKVIQIPNGVDTQKFCPSVKPVKLNLERPIFLTVGEFIPAKRLDLAIKAVAHLKKGSLVVLGDGPLKNKLVLLGRRLLGGRRFRLEKVSHNEISAYYTAADIFTLPSLLEPSPLVYLEAAAANLTLVAPDEERRKSILGEAAYYCQVEDLSEYSQTLEKASLNQLGEKPRRLAKKYSWEKIAQRYIWALKSVLNQAS